MLFPVHYSWKHYCHWIRAWIGKMLFIDIQLRSKHLVDRFRCEQLSVIGTYRLQDLHVLCSGANSPTPPKSSTSFRSCWYFSSVNAPYHLLVVSLLNAPGVCGHLVSARYGRSCSWCQVDPRDSSACRFQATYHLSSCPVETCPIRPAITWFKDRRCRNCLDHRRLRRYLLPMKFAPANQFLI